MSKRKQSTTPEPEQVEQVPEATTTETATPDFTSYITALEAAGYKVKAPKTAKVKSTSPAAPRGHKYGLTGAELPEKQSMQAKFILDALHDGPMTKAELAKAAEAAGQEVFPCRQPYDRAVGFYLSKFKSEGILRFDDGETVGEHLDEDESGEETDSTEEAA